MNKLPGKIISIQNSDHFYLIEVDVMGQTFSALITEMPHDGEFLQKGRKVYVVFKDTEVTMAKNLEGFISLSNRFQAIVKTVITRKILGKITLDWKGHSIHSVITAASAQRLDIRVGEILECLIKANAVSLMEFAGD